MRRKIRVEKEQRGFIWQCQVTTDKKQYIAQSETKKQPCGQWNSYFGRKWASEKRDARWQGICPCNHQGKGARKRQLNLGVVFPEPPNYYATRKEAVEAARAKNAEEAASRRFL